MRELAIEYAGLELEVKRSIPFAAYCKVATMNIRKKGNNLANENLHHKLGKLSISSFYGTKNLSPCLD